MERNIGGRPAETIRDLEIFRRKAAGERTGALGREYGISPGRIRAIVRQQAIAAAAAEESAAAAAAIAAEESAAAAAAIAAEESAAAAAAIAAEESAAAAAPPARRPQSGYIRRRRGYTGP